MLSSLMQYDSSGFIMMLYDKIFFLQRQYLHAKILHNYTYHYTTYTADQTTLFSI